MARRLFISVALLAATAVSATAQTSDRGEEARIEFFEKKVRPLLVDNCFNCHSANTNSRGGLRVDDRNGLVGGGDRGPAIVPGQPDKSLLMHAVRHTHGEVKMPPKKHLTEEQIADLSRWIQDGAAWPRLRVPASLTRPDPEYDRLRKKHWAWQPLRDNNPPTVRQSLARTDVDRFLLAALEAKGLTPVPDADAVTLVRRLTFDLTGLPPTPDEAREFLKEHAAKPDAAIERLVDRLLASPAYGEKWGRHWLDVARYGESTGSARNLPYPHAWRYRDYVIDAFQHDKPYDQFIREQIAGDLLPAATQAQRDQQLIATGFLALGVRDVNQRFKVRFVMDNIDEQIDTVTRSVLALTVSCARCHNHKFDPIPATDYYALAGIFHSTDLCAGLRNKMGGGGMDYYDTARVLPLGPPTGPDAQRADRIAQAQAELAKARADLLVLAENPDNLPAGPEREQKLAAARKQVTKVQNELIALDDPALSGPVALGARDSRNPSDTEIRIRGEAEQLGPVVPRGFLSVLEVPGAVKIDPAQSGRLQLAQWLTSPNNPLTPRVMVNRIWRHLFGEGLVGSVDNFGVNGDLPSHPELLDYLAQRFVRDGWSVKKLVRALVLSRAYQLGSDAPSANVSIDPGNRLVWRHSPRRLTAEEIRDATLAAAATLNRNRPKGSPAMDLKVTELSNKSPLARRLEEDAENCLHRSVYLPLVRGLTPRPLDVFDFAEQGMVTGSRDTTTVAPQALYLLNDPFVKHQAQALAERVLGSEKNTANRIALAYRLAVSREATAAEIERASFYLADYETAARAEATAPTTDPRTAAWASFCQAILASAEFRYLQ